MSSCVGGSFGLTLPLRCSREYLGTARRVRHGGRVLTVSRRHTRAAQQSVHSRARQQQSSSRAEQARQARAADPRAAVSRQHSSSQADCVRFLARADRASLCCRRRTRASCGRGGDRCGPSDLRVHSSPNLYSLSLSLARMPFYV